MAKPKRRRGRPAGGEEIVAPVLQATLDELGAQGLTRLSIERIAKAAGVNKTSVYRRWPTKIDLVLAAVRTLREQPLRVDPTDLRGALVKLLAAKAHALSDERGRRIGRALFMIDSDDPAAAEEACAMRRQGQARITELVAAAVERGELDESTDAQLATDLLVAPLLYRVLLLGEKVTAAEIATMVDTTLDGLTMRESSPK